MAQLHPEMPVYQRIAMIAEALAKALNRGPEMSVEATGSASNDLGLYVIKRPWSDERVAHELHDIARELEVLL